MVAQEHPNSTYSRVQKRENKMNTEQIEFEIAAEGSGEEEATDEVSFLDLRVEEDRVVDGIRHIGGPIGIAKRAMAGLHSLADRADLRFEVLETSRVAAPSGYGDYDVSYRVMSTHPERCRGQFGRNAQLTFTCAVHVTGSGRLEAGGLYVKDFEDNTILEVEGSGGEVTTFRGNLNEFVAAQHVQRRIAERFFIELACRQLVDTI